MDIIMLQYLRFLDIYIRLEVGLYFIYKKCFKDSLNFFIFFFLNPKNENKKNCCLKKYLPVSIYNYLVPINMILTTILDINLLKRAKHCCNFIKYITNTSYTYL